MSILVWLVIGIGVLWAVAALAAFVISNVAEALGLGAAKASSVGSSAANSVAKKFWHFLGKGYVDPGLSIPSSLDLEISRKPVLEVALHELQNWKPKLVHQAKIRSIVFQSALADKSHELASSISVGEIDDLNSTVPTELLSSLYVEVDTKRAYPISAPEPSQEICPPPSLSLPATDIAEPVLALPLYSSPWTFLNYFVRRAHVTSIAKFNTAIIQRDETLVWSMQIRPNLNIAHQAAKQSWQSAVQAQREVYETTQEQWRKEKEDWESKALSESLHLKGMRGDYEAGTSEGVASYLQLALTRLSLPPALPRASQLSYDPNARIVVLEHDFPNVLALAIEQVVHLKKGRVRKIVSTKDRRSRIEQLQAGLALRIIVATFLADDLKHVDAIALNGVVLFTEAATGLNRKTYCFAVIAKRVDIEKMDWSKADPLAALKAWGAASAGEHYDLAPIKPTLELEHDDPRFVPGRDVLIRMARETNLAAMDWNDFEHLIRQLFEKAFVSQGAEVHVTRASHDQGVDAIILDPDPLRGGKIIVQAKRYTNLVDVSAVRDLYGAVTHERAARGILVTTSDFGHESYSFAMDKPITLLNGQKLLGLLAQHGYKFRIDIEEARRLLGLSA